MKLRPYQEEAIDNVRKAIRQGSKKVVLQASTGLGKTVMSAGLMKSAIEKGSRILFIAHRRELIHQCSDKLNGFDIKHSIIMAGEGVNEAWHPVQVASIQTLTARIKSKRLRKPKADIIIIDECHRTLSKSYIDLIEMYTDAIVVGLTATPIRGNGKGLGSVYEDMVETMPMTDAIEQGFLCDVDYYAPVTADMNGVKITAGDYNQKQLGAKMDKPKLIGDIVKHWIEIADNKKTVVFASSVNHSINIMNEFKRHGIAAGHIDGTTPQDEREETLQALEDDKIKVICNCMILTEGWDMPSVEVCVLARPTKSLGLYIQMGGRSLRTSSGKDKAIIIDHASCVYEHGFLDSDFEWQLDISRGGVTEVKKNKKEKTPITCSNCNHVYEGRLDCPQCGSEIVIKERKTLVEAGRLGKIKRDKSKKAKKTKATYTTQIGQDVYSELLWYADEKRYNQGWAYHKYREYFGKNISNKFNKHMKRPTAEILRFITHQNIKRAYSYK